MRRLAVAAAAVSAAWPMSSAQAAGWVNVAESTSGVVHAIDPERISPVYGSVWRAWVRADASRAAPKLSFDSAMTQYEFNCTNQTSRTLSFTAYDANKQVINSWNSPTSDPVPVVPDSILESLLKTVCSASLQRDFKRWLEDNPQK